MDPERNNDMVAKRSLVIGRMIASLRRGEPRGYYVGLVGYLIEGIPYSASGLSVDLTATPDIFQADSGFSCTAFFPPMCSRREPLEGMESFRSVPASS